MLHLTGTDDGFLGILRRWVRPPLTEWTIRARLGRAADEGFAEVYWLTGDDAFPLLGISLGPDDENNYTLWWFNPEPEEGAEEWYPDSRGTGYSNAVRVEPGEFTDLTIGFDGETLFAAAGDTELFAIPLQGSSRRALERVWQLRMAAFPYNTTQRFDWIQLTGIESGADMSDGVEAIRRGDLAIDAIETSRGNSIRSMSLPGTRSNGRRR